MFYMVSHEHMVSSTKYIYTHTIRARAVMSDMAGTGRGT